MTGSGPHVPRSVSSRARSDSRRGGAPSVRSGVVAAGLLAALAALPACAGEAGTPARGAETTGEADVSSQEAAVSPREADVSSREADVSAQEADVSPRESGKQPFSEVARTMIDEEGVDAARRELGGMMTLQRDRYTLDVDGMVALAREYLDDGEVETALVAANLAWLMDGRSPEANLVLGDAYVAQGSETSATMYYETALRHDPDYAPAREALAALGSELPDEKDARREAERAEREAANASIDRDRGPMRDDLERFRGRYADPDREQSHHVFWVAETCAGSGYLMAGAEWGDVAPWILRSESETEFHQTLAMPGQEPLQFEFELGPDGTPTAVTMTGLYDDPARLERLGPLEEGWQPEGEDCRIDRPG